MILSLSNLTPTNSTSLNSVLLHLLLFSVRPILLNISLALSITSYVFVSIGTTQATSSAYASAK